ncbi:hypothetical protein BXZ70DRAFT_954193 [Cristinia sonorae]|uniref:EH domain-containing protein n=1 Tax=Cristinia sonorae TaxID=1940300 RepID=A0A8K0XLG6_9AGAR|nr:hypothetical protein BXZ70DRAFT_954193 [Cristinia sonorae]
MPPPPSTTSSRSLTLHVSALNDSEYDYFTSSFSDLLPHPYPDDDSKYDHATVTTREARAWLRGRYSAVPVADLDAILKTISPNHDALSAGQFFAVMRLITHVAAGKGLDGSLVFVQCHPTDDPPHSKTNKLPPPPPHHPAQDGKKPVPVPLPHKRHPPAPRPPERDIVDVPNLSSSPPIAPKPTNPFLNRSKSTHDMNTLPIAPPAPAARFKTTGTMDGKQPPLPPRKPAPPPPPRHVSSGFVPPASGTTNVLIQQSLQAGRIAASLKKAEEKLQQERVLEVLKTSSPSKRNRSISPTKDISSGASASGSAGSGYSSAERPPPVLPPRRRSELSPETSPRLSVRSLDQVATAGVGTHKPRYPTSSPFRRDQSTERVKPPPPPPPIRSPSRSPPKRTAELSPESPTSTTISQPPPTHPDRKPATSMQDWSSDASNPPSPNTRLFRSKSMHQQSPPLPPPVRRKRPESVQITPTDGDAPSWPQSPSRPTGSSLRHSSLSRHLSLSSPPYNGDHRGTGVGAGASLSDSSPIAGLQKTFNNLTMKAQPKLDAARYKAEAGFSRRGFVPHGNGNWMRREGEERLIDEPDTLADAPLASSPFNHSREDLDSSEVSGSGVSEGEDRERRNWEGRLKSMRGSQSHTGQLSSGREKRASKVLVGADPGELSKVKDRTWLFERDGLKWQAGEGWKPL